MFLFIGGIGWEVPSPNAIPSTIFQNFGIFFCIFEEKPLTLYSWNFYEFFLASSLNPTPNQRKKEKSCSSINIANAPKEHFTLFLSPSRSPFIIPHYALTKTSCPKVSLIRNTNMSSKEGFTLEKHRVSSCN